MTPLLNHLRQEGIRPRMKHGFDTDRSTRLTHPCSFCVSSVATCFTFSRGRAKPWFAAVIAILACGCAPPAAAPPSPAPPTAQPPAAEVRLRVADEKDLAALVAANRGRVVLIDGWATWCGPCKEQFPHTVELHRKLAPRGLTVVSLSCNDPDEKEAVLKFLRNQQATFDNLLSRYGASEEGFNTLGIKTGALPYYLLFDRRGKLRDDLGSGTKTEGLKREELDRAVNLLLDEK